MTLSPAAYPMVDEAEASGRVAGTYSRILERFPMVPSLFKSLAVHPIVLALAWDQTSGVLDDDRFGSEAELLVATAAGAVPPPEDERISELLSRFVDPLARMLLVTAGLHLGVTGRLDGPPARIPPTDGAPSRQPELNVPPTSQLDSELVGAIRRDLATPIVNSVWRYAAAQDVLADAWRHLSPHTRMTGFVSTSQGIRDRSVTAARQIDWPTVASPEVLDRHGSADAASGSAAILDAYLTTLPRVLVLVAGVRTGA